jgi:site-specific DNA-methyltransferase (adenine-specific)/site-specific DNA-methyltransferase (cytosine-N4-specific)
MKENIPDNSIDCVITSPPYAEQRKNTYGGIPESEYPEWMESIGKEIFRILKPSGSFVLNIKEHVDDYCRSTYVMETVIKLSKILMFNDTYIWNKPNPFPTGNKKRLKDGFEYCYFFTKTKDYKFFTENVLVQSESRYLIQEKRRKCKNPSKCTNGSGMGMHKRFALDLVRPSNVLTINAGIKPQIHPATFPEELPRFFIKLLTEEHDIVYDPFAGSGTTLVASKKLNRHYLGTEIHPEYIELIKQNLNFATVFDKW